MILIALCAAFLSTKIIILNSAPLYEGMPMRVQPDIEEFYTANVAIELINGPLLPLHAYCDRPYEGYIVVNGLLSIPFFLLFGTTYFALKLTAVIFGLLTLIALFLFARRAFGLNVAALASCIYLFAPPGIQRFSLWAMGHYPQSQLLCLLIIMATFRICFHSDRERIRTGNVVLLGVLSGFSLYFHPLCIIFVLYSLIALFFYRRDFFRPRAVLIFALTLLAGSGLWPLRMYGTLSDHVHFPHKTSFFTSQNLMDIRHRAEVLFSSFFARMWYYEDLFGGGGKLLNYGLYVMIIAACVFLFVKTKRKNLLFIEHAGDNKRICILLLFPPLFILAYCFSNFVQPFNPASVRFLLPLYPLFCLLLALFLLNLSQTGRTRAKATAWFTGSILLAVNIAGTINLFSPQSSPFRDMDAYWGWMVGKQVIRHYGANNLHSVRGKIMESRAGEYQQQIIRGIADSLANICRRHGIEALNEEAAKAPKHIRSEIFRASGRTMAQRFKYKVTPCVELAEGLETEDRNYYYEGVGSTFGYHHIVREKEITCERVQHFENTVESMPVQYRDACYRGFGAVAMWNYDSRTHIRMGNNPARFRRLCDCASPQYRASFEKGKGFGYYRFPEW